MLYGLVSALSTNTLPSPATKQPLATENNNQGVRESNTIAVPEKSDLQKILYALTSEEQSHLLRTYLSTIEAQQVKNIALYFTQQNLSFEKTLSIQLVIAEHWLSFSPSDAITFSIEHLPQAISQITIELILLKSCNSPSTVINCVTGLPENNKVDRALLNIATKFSQSGEPIKAVYWASTIGLEELRIKSVNDVAQRWVSDSPEAAFEWANSREDFTGIAKIAIVHISHSDAWLAYSLVSYIPDDNGDVRGEMYNAIIENLIKKQDFTTVMSILESASHHESIADVARSWIDSDPKTALQWALSYDDYSVFALRAVDQLTIKEHWQAFEIASQVADNKTKLREDMFNSIISDRASNADFNTIMSMLEQLPGSELPETYYPSFIDQWSWQDPHAAIEAVLTLPDSVAKSISLATAMSALAIQSPQDALRLSSNITNTTIKASATGGAIAGWAVHDIDQVLDWASDQTSSEDLDESIHVASQRLLDSEIDNESLVRLTNNIYSNELRDKLLKEIENRLQPDDEFDN